MTGGVAPFYFGLIGHKLGHSVSPVIHHAALNEFCWQGKYELFSVPLLPEGEADLVDILMKVRSGILDGVNVTIPHKRSVLPYLDDLTWAARDIQAVNTIYLSNGKLIGDNTDVDGLLTDLRRYRTNYQNAIILGAGGAARAAAYGLVRSGCRVGISSRRAEQSRALISDLAALGVEFQKGLHLVEYTADGLAGAVQACDLIINATPCGMVPAVGVSPWIGGSPFPLGALVYDMVYNPQETEFIREAKNQGIEAVSGLGMLVNQAGLAFKRWTGKQPTYETLYHAAEMQLLLMNNQKEKT